LTVETPRLIELSSGTDTKDAHELKIQRKRYLEKRPISQWGEKANIPRGWGVKAFKKNCLRGVPFSGFIAFYSPVF
jgi:hypothetical protein